MIDFTTSGPNIPSLDLLAQNVSALTDQITHHGANLGQAPPGMGGLDLQEWNIGQLTQALPHRPTMDMIVQQARTIYPNYDQLPPDQQRIARSMANVSLFAEMNRQQLQGDVLQPGNPGQPSLALDAQARKMYGSDAWMLNIPEIRTVLEQGAQQGWDQGTLEAKVRSTQWWQTTTQAQQEFLHLQATSPAELNFDNPGSRAQTTLQQVMSDASKAGYPLDQATARSLAMKAMQFGWNDQLILTAITAQTQYANPATWATNAPPIAHQIAQTAAEYFQKLDPASTATWANQITSGQQTFDTFKAHLSDQAKQKWVGMANQLDQGLTPYQITSGLRSDAAQTMETDPTRIDFLNDPVYQKLLDYVPPGETGHRLMTHSEATTYLKSQPSWGYTQQARDQGGSLAKNILTTLGRIA